MSNKALWYAIRTKPNKEQVACLNCEQQGLTVYLPMIRKTVRHARQKKDVLRPFFPGYLFLRLTPEELNWPTIRSTRGVLEPVHFGGTYVPVPDWIIDQLKDREESGALNQSALKRQTLQPGTEVAVNLGNHSETEGVVFSWRGKDNVIVLLNLLSRKVRVTVSQDRVDAIKS